MVEDYIILLIWSFSFKLTFGKQVFLLSGWNGSVEIHQKLTKEYIINEIESNRGRQFDPAIADVMLKLLRSPDNLLDF